MLTLKNIKYAAFKSEETHCYSATLYFGGTKIASVGNNGHGGPDDVRWLCSKCQQDQALEWIDSNLRTANDPEFTDLYATSSPYTLLEFWCSDAINDYLAEKELKKLLAKRVLWTTKENPGIYQTQVAKNAANRDAWVEQIAQKADVDQILNTLPADKALELFRERT